MHMRFYNGTFDCISIAFLKRNGMHLVETGPLGWLPIILVACASVLCTHTMFTFIYAKLFKLNTVHRVT